MTDIPWGTVGVQNDPLVDEAEQERKNTLKY